MRRRFTICCAATLLVTAPVAAQPSVEDLVARGDSAQDAFRPADALRLYQEALALDSSRASVLGRASRSAVDLAEGEGDAARRRDHFQLGERYARRAVALDSLDAETQFHLARALGRAALSVGVRERVRYAVEVRERGRTALRLRADHPGALHVLGVWNAEVKRLNGFEKFFAQNFLGGRIFGEATWQEAVAYLERAVAVDPGRLTHHLALGMIYADIGEKAKAREQLRHVVDAPVQTDVNDPLYKRQAAEALRRLR
jgi:tetratricopeptide (TPR) repeat protein